MHRNDRMVIHMDTTHGHDSNDRSELRYRKTKQQLVDDNEQAARIALYLPQLHAQKEKLEADLHELEHLALSGWGYALSRFRPVPVVDGAPAERGEPELVPGQPPHDTRPRFPPGHVPSCRYARPDSSRLPAGSPFHLSL